MHVYTIPSHRMHCMAIFSGMARLLLPRRVRSQQTRSLRLAFKILQHSSQSGFVDRIQFKKLMEISCAQARQPYQPARVEAVWLRMDTRNRGTIREDEFTRLADAVAFAERAQRGTPLPRWLQPGAEWHARGALAIPLALQHGEEGGPSLEISAVAARDRSREATQSSGLKELDSGRYGEHLRTVGGRAGMLRCSLSWDQPHELDLHCRVDFSGDARREGGVSGISFRQRSGPCGGQLEQLSEPTLENMYWERPPRGTYTFEIRNERPRRDGEGAKAVKYSCEIFFAHGGFVSDVGESEAIERDAGYCVNIDGEVLPENSKTFEFEWGGPEEVEQRLHGTIPRLQRCAKTLALTHGHGGEEGSRGIRRFYNDLSVDATTPPCKIHTVHMWLILQGGTGLWMPPPSASRTRWTSLTSERGTPWTSAWSSTASMGRRHRAVRGSSPPALGGSSAECTPRRGSRRWRCCAGPGSQRGMARRPAA